MRGEHYGTAPAMLFIEKGFLKREDSEEQLSAGSAAVNVMKKVC